MRKLLHLAIAAIAILIFLPRCASIGSISGGDKDTIAPVIVSSTPRMYQTVFFGKEIKLTFDEYVVLKDPAKQFFISPPLETKVFPMPKGKSVVIKLEKPLDEKTTYTIGFGDCIVDNNEGNPIKNLQLVFSTGANLDTLAVEGFLTDAFNQTVPADVKVFLYKEQDDSLPYLKNPSYYAYPDKSGFFRVPNVPKGSYKLIAIADKNDNLRYDQGAELVGYTDTPIQASVKQPIDSATRSTPAGKLPLVSLFTEEPVNLTLVETTRPKADLVKLIFSRRNPELPKINITGVSKDQIAIEHSRNNDTVLFWILNSDQIKQDSIKATLTYLYTSEKRILEYKTQEVALSFEINKSGKGDNNKNDKNKAPLFDPTLTGISNGVIPAVGVEFNFATPPVRFDVSKVLFTAKTEKDSLVQPFTLEKTDKPRSLKLNINWKDSTTYFYKILPGAFTSASGNENDTLIGRINVAKKEDFGTLIFKNSGVKKPVILQLLARGKIYKEFPIKSDGTLTVDYVPADTYSLKIIFDDNDNQQWDSGNLLKKIQPEMVKFYKPTGSKGTFIVKKNWENEIVLDINDILTK